MITNAQPRWTLYKYQVTESAVRDPHFELNPVGQFTVGTAGEAARDTIPLMSITAYSTYKLMNSDPGIISD
jgi:hypothetical protein